MTTDRKDKTSILLVIAALASCASIVVTGADFGDRFWGSKSDSQVTSYQVSQLTEAVRKLADKFDNVAKQSSVDALTARMEHDEGASGDRFNADELKANTIDGRVTALGDRVTSLEHPRSFRDPH